MTRSEKQSWEQERAKGYSHYLSPSIMRIGLPVVIAIQIIVLWIPALRYLIPLGFCIVGFSFLMRHWSWQSKEREYKCPTEDV